MTASFGDVGPVIRPAEGAWTWGLQLMSWGFVNGRKSRPVSAQVTTDGTKLTYGHQGGLDEWWDNGPSGFEHGFTIAERPEEPAGGPLPKANSTLQFELQILSQLEARISEDHLGIGFWDETGHLQLRYSGLIAFDANGKHLEAWLNAEGDELLIYVDTQGAVYPITVDPVVESGNTGALLTAGNADNLDYFGWAVAISGDTIVVGSQLEDNDATGVFMAPVALADWGNSPLGGTTGLPGQVCGQFRNFDAGAAYVYQRDSASGSWSLEAYLKPSVNNQGAFFGESVVIDGDTIFIGAPMDDMFGIDAGAVYAYERTYSAGTPTWTEEVIMSPANAAAGDRFGTSLAYDNGKLVVGAPEKDGAGTALTDAGAAYVLDYSSGGSYSQDRFITAPNADAADRFGWSVAIYGTTVVIGAEHEEGDGTSQSNNMLPKAGAVYAYDDYNNPMAAPAYLKAFDSLLSTMPTENAFFGATVAVWGDRIAVGAWGEGETDPMLPPSQEGAAYVFQRNSVGTWVPDERVADPNGEDVDHFGFAVGLRNDVLVVGARQVTLPSSSSGARNGAAYVYVRTAAGWLEDTYLISSQPSGRGYFGRTIAMSRGFIVIGSVGGDVTNPVALCAGSVNAFPVRPTISVGQNYCTPVNNSTGMPGAMSAVGSPFAADNHLIITCTDLPTMSNGTFLVGPTMGFTMNPGGSQGNLCLDNPIGRYPSQSSGSTGTVELTLDLTATPVPSGTTMVMAGQTWNFQFWHRDLPASNFSDGLSITFL